MPISGKAFELKLKQFELYYYLKIYNLESEEKYHIEYLKIIKDMNIKDFNFSISGVRKIFENSTNYEIIDTIIQIGENILFNILIEILNDKKMDINKICDYLIKSEEQFKKFQNYSKTRNYKASRLYKSSNNSKENKKAKIDENSNIKNKGRKCLLCLDDTIPRTLEHDEYVKNLIDNIKEDLSKNPDIKFNNEDFKKDLEKRLNEYNEKKSHVFSLTILYLNNIY